MKRNKCNHESKNSIKCGNEIVTNNNLTSIIKNNKNTTEIENKKKIAKCLE